MIALDASVVIAHLDATDAHHSSAGDLLLRTSDDAWEMHPLDVAELLVQAVRSGREDDLVEDLALLGIEVTAMDAGAPLRLARLRVSTGLCLPDCCVIDLALTRGGRLATFDRRLATAATTLGVAVLTAPD